MVHQKCISLNNLIIMAALRGSHFNFLSMDSIRFDIEANEQQQEILISELSELGAEGFEQTDKSLIAYFNPHILDSYEVNDLLKPYKFEITTIKEQNWNEV